MTESSSFNSSCANRLPPALSTTSRPTSFNNHSKPLTSSLHGAVGAGMSAMRGGDVGLGFFSAMIPGAFAGEINGIGGSDQFGVFARTLVSGDA